MCLVFFDGHGGNAGVKDSGCPATTANDDDCPATGAKESGCRATAAKDDDCQATGAEYSGCPATAAKDGDSNDGGCPATTANFPAMATAANSSAKDIG